MFSEMLERNLGCGIEEAGEVYFSLLSRTLAGNPKQAELEYVNELFQLLPEVRQCLAGEDWSCKGGKGYFVVRQRAKEVRSTEEWMKTLIRKTKAGVSCVYHKKAEKIKSFKLVNVHTKNLIDPSPSDSRWYIEDVCPAARIVLDKAKASLGGEHWDEQFKHVWGVEKDEVEGLKVYDLEAEQAILDEAVEREQEEEKESDNEEAPEQSEDEGDEGSDQSEMEKHAEVGVRRE